VLLKVEKPIFQIKKMVGMESNNPNWNRLFYEFGDIFNTNLILLPKETIKEIESALFECTKELIHIENYFKQYCIIKDGACRKIQVEGLAVKNKMVEWEDPTTLLHKCFADFLIRCLIVLRYRTKIAILFFNDKDLDQHTLFRKRIHNAINSNKERLGNLLFNSYNKMLNDDSRWIKTLKTLRDKIEHVEHEKLELTSFDITINNTNLEFHFPVIVGLNKFIHTYMEETFYNLYTYLEDFTAMLLNLHCKEICVIRKVKEDYKQIPDDNVVDLGSYKYVIDLKDEVEKSLFGSDD